MIPKIDYKKISDAIQFYDALGFAYLEVPWIASKEANVITAPKGVKYFENFLGCNVASGEQSFLELILKRDLNEGKHFCCTPCFRDEKVLDEYHFNWFMKVELIDFLGYEKIGDYEKNQRLENVILSGESFFERYLDVERLKTKSGIDLISKFGKIELGSYGIREHKDFSWIYGTGVAEPRLSQNLAIQNRGYHLEDIPKGNLGEASKIYEEVEEFRDSLKQQNKLMGLLELSDLIGAIEFYLEKNYENKICLNDLIKMKDVTKRAFENGKRH